MTKSLILPVLLAFFCLSAFADNGDKPKKNKEQPDSLELALTAYYAFEDSVNKAMTYNTGLITLSQGNATLNIPPGFKFLNAAQAQFVITQVWGNPERDDVLGLLLPESATPFSDSSYAFVVSYEEMGYVKDDDAKKIDYDDMMSELQESEAEANKSREAAGYEPIHIAGWAQKPFYDENKKILHWAKNIRFGDAESNTLNYEVRVLGRKGILSLNAVAAMSELHLVKKDINKVLSMAGFTPGNTYADFKPGIDNIAAYTIGGLVAGKVLAKVGFFAFFAKFAKVIIAAIIGLFFLIRKALTGKGRKDETEPSNTVLPDGNNPV